MALSHCPFWVPMTSIANVTLQPGSTLLSLFDISCYVVSLHAVNLLSLGLFSFLATGAHSIELKLRNPGSVGEVRVHGVGMSIKIFHDPVL
jgi:hypothetical protein